MDPYYSATLTVSQGTYGCDASIVLIASDGTRVLEERTVWPSQAPIPADADPTTWLRRALTHLVRDFDLQETTQVREWALTPAEEVSRG